MSPTDSRLRNGHPEPTRASSSMLLDADFGELYVPPTKSLGRVPILDPIKSGGKAIEGDFPLDQTVIARKLGS